MDEPDDDNLPLRPQDNDTYDGADRGRSPTQIPYFIPRRPRVVKMRDLSPATRDQLTREYFDAYDPWTGIRIAATLGILISLFTLFLIYKSRFNQRRAALPSTKKTTSLYLYDDMDLDCDLGSLTSSGGRSAYGLSFAYKSHPDEQFRCFEEGYQLQEVYVKPSVVALKVKRSSKSGGPKVGTLRITEDVSRSLPCSPYKQQEQEEENTDVKQPPSPVASTSPSSLVGSITSFGSVDLHIPEVADKSSKESSKTGAKSKKGESSKSKTHAKSMVVTAKKPQDYRSRSTVVSIARRQRKAS